MRLSAEQVKQLHTLLQEYPTTDFVEIESISNSSGIGPSEFAKFYSIGPGFTYKLLGSAEITDVGMW